MNKIFKDLKNLKSYLINIRKHFKREIKKQLVYRWKFLDKN